MTAAVAVTFALRGVLRQHAGGAGEVEVSVPAPATLGRALDVLRERHPAVERRVRDETGRLRRHVNVFVDGADVRRGDELAHPLAGGEQILVLPAISGG